MLVKVLEYIKIHNMINEYDRIVVGVSGGADSIALLYYLYELSKTMKIELFAVHINHGIRGVEANRDEKFVEEFCKRLGIKFKAFSYNVSKIATDRGITEEEAGRKVRYKSFYKSCEYFDANKIAVAHNKNDNAETIIFHLIRGSGIKGLSGISSKRELSNVDSGITIIRPMLCLSREEIEGYLRLNNIDYKIDSTNLTNNYTRNKIRNKIIAYIVKEINVNAIDNIVKAGEHLSEISRYLENDIDSVYYNIVKEENDVYSFIVDTIENYDIVIQKGLVRRILGNMKSGLKDIESKHIEQIILLFDKSVGKSINLPGKRVVKRGYNNLEFYIDNNLENECKEDEESFKISINKIPYAYDLLEYNKILEVKIINNEEDIKIPKKTCIKWLDYDKIENTIKIRAYEENDYIQLFKNGGKKRISDYFIDIKIPKEDRKNVLLAADGNNILWILDERAAFRISERYKINSNTNSILEMKLINNMED